MSSAVEQRNRSMLRAADAMDAAYADPLDIAALAQLVSMSPAHFIRTFKATFGETPHRYLQRRRVERASALLRQGDLSITDICMRVGFSSLGTFSRTFTEIIGRTPSDYRRTTAPFLAPGCVVRAATRPSSFGEAAAKRGTLA